MSKYTVYKNKDFEKEKSITRVVLFEKLRAPDFINKSGLKYWYDKNGNTIRIDNEDSTVDLRDYFIGFKGSSYMDAGYVFAPYVPLETVPSISQVSLITNIARVSNYISAHKNSQANYVICSSEVSNILSNL